MINRRNYHDVRAYLHYRAHTRQNSPSTVARVWSYLRHLLEWADAVPLPQARLIDPVYPHYLTTAHTFAPSTLKKTLGAARNFFAWARASWPVRYRPISQSWIDTLQPPREYRHPMDAERQIYTIDDMRAIVSIQPASLRQQRAQAAACMLFLSGMRAGALSSLPIAAVDLARRAIRQDPALGVRTKNRKAAVTYLLRVPDLPEMWRIVSAWDARVRASLPPAALWYAGIARDNSRVLPMLTPSDYRHNTVQDDIRLVCDLASIPYRSPHKFRHGHVVYALQRVEDMAQFKAVSQNVMHSSVTITDQIYGRLLGDDVRDIITNL